MDNLPLILDAGFLAFLCGDLVGALPCLAVILNPTHSNIFFCIFLSKAMLKLESKYARIFCDVFKSAISFSAQVRGKRIGIREQCYPK
jgi:hypothetical protein